MDWLGLTYLLMLMLMLRALGFLLLDAMGRERQEGAAGDFCLRDCIEVSISN